MTEGRLPKIALKWMPKQKRAWGRLKKKWIEGIKKAMNGTDLKESQWEVRKQWRLGVGQRRKSFETGDDDDDDYKTKICALSWSIAKTSKKSSRHKTQNAVTSVAKHTIHTYSTAALL
jgi:hypothetical protein